MAIITRAQLRKWFGRGQYPTAEQFSDAFDSFLHKSEDKIDINGIDGLADQLNGKLSAADGQVLAEAVGQIATDLATHRTESNEAIDQLREQLDQLREDIKDNYIKKSDRVFVNGGTPSDLTDNI